MRRLRPLVHPLKNKTLVGNMWINNANFCSPAVPATLRRDVRFRLVVYTVTFIMELSPNKSLIISVINRVIHIIHRKKSPYYVFSLAEELCKILS